MSGETGSRPDEEPAPNEAPANELAVPDWSSLQRGRFSYLPVVPGRLEFAIEVRRRILAERPAVVAVELPETLEGVYLDALQRLPD